MIQADAAKLRVRLLFNLNAGGSVKERNNVDDNGSQDQGR